MSRKPSVGAIQRTLLVLEQQGGAHFFGEPALQIADIMRTTRDGRGAISVLAADKLMMNPRLYATFLLWLMSELFEELPEVGDPDKPKLVFFFDEAHLLFNEAPKVADRAGRAGGPADPLEGVGVYFVTQNPLDVPETVLAQLGNRVQHALRAYTPREQKAVRTAAETFRPNPDFDCAKAITQLGMGEALVSTLEDKGVPSMVQRTLIRPPASRLGPVTEAERASRSSPKARSPARYDKAVDRELAFETLEKRAKAAAQAEADADERAPQSGRSRWTPAGFRRRRDPARRCRERPADRPAGARAAAAMSARPSPRRRSNRWSARSVHRSARLGARRSGRPEEGLLTEHQ